MPKADWLDLVTGLGFSFVAIGADGGMVSAGLAQSLETLSAKKKDLIVKIKLPLFSPEGGAGFQSEIAHSQSDIAHQWHAKLTFPPPRSHA